MSTTDRGSKRSLTVLAVVVACFAVLWPKIFYPMIQSIIFPYDEEENQNSIKKLNYDDMIHPQMRESMGEARPVEKSMRDENRGLFHPHLRNANKPQSKSAGAVNLLIPVYTIAIIFFFLYSVLKMAFKRWDEAHNSFVEKSATSLCSNAFCSKFSKKDELLTSRKEIQQERKAQRALEQYGKDKVLTALKTIILEMEDIKGNFNDQNVKAKLPDYSTSFDS